MTHNTSHRATTGDNLNIHYYFFFLIYENKIEEALITQSTADKSYHVLSTENSWSFKLQTMAGGTDAQDYWVPELTAGIAIFLSSLNIFLSITATLGNVLTLVALRNLSPVHPPTKLLLRCLAVMDLCVGLISQLLFVIIILNSVTKINMNILFYFSRVMVASAITLSGVSIYTLMALSVDRLLALLLGLRYRQVVTLRRVFTAVCCFWLMSILWGFGYSFWRHPVIYTTGAVIGILSLCISLFSCSKIFLTLRQRQAQVQFEARHERARGGIPPNIARYKKSVSSVAWVQLALVVWYLPYYISFVIILLSGWRGMTADFVMTCAGTFLYSNSSLNPILYCWKIKDVRQVMKTTVRSLFCL